MLGYTNSKEVDFGLNINSLAEQINSYQKLTQYQYLEKYFIGECETMSSLKQKIKAILKFSWTNDATIEAFWGEIVTKAVKRTLYLPSIAKKVLYQGNWLSFAEWTNLQKPALDVKRKYYFLFSSRFLSMEKAGKYSYYFVELTQFSNVSINLSFSFL